MYSLCDAGVKNIPSGVKPATSRCVVVDMTHFVWESKCTMQSSPCPLGAAQTVPTCDTSKSFTLFTVYYQTMNAYKNLHIYCLAKMPDLRCEWRGYLNVITTPLLKFVFLLLHQIVSNHACTYSRMPEYNLNTEVPVVLPNLHICLPLTICQ